ncbi:MAG: DSBA oxidoreductase [Cenarchaeum symbiont of Oopsacas minuta]|nr:DSBA oxidoreductase [Cenarchaeum symbiont of Oopsacas minuta]
MNRYTKNGSFDKIFTIVLKPYYMKNRYLALVAIPVIIGILSVVYITQDSPKTDELTIAGLIDGASPILGNTDAEIIIIEWGDYQCEYCHKFHQNTLDAIKVKYVDTGVANIVFRDFILNGPDSELAALASHCAEDQGKFWEYHNALYENWGGERTGWITDESLLALAVSLDLDVSKFDLCVDSKTHTDRVIESTIYGKSIGIGATPTFLISNGQDVIKISGAQPMSVFERAIESL